MQTVQKLITSFLVTDFIREESTIQVIVFIAVLLVVIRKETLSMRKESQNFAFRTGRKNRFTWATKQQ